MFEKVLVVDDETVLRKAVSYTLQKDGMEVVEAADGEEAVELIDQGGSFDALVTDVQMPGRVNGIQVAEHARVASPDLPVIVVSGDTGGASVPELGEHGTFLAKPFSLTTLVSLLRRFLSAVQKCRSMTRRSSLPHKV